MKHIVVCDVGDDTYHCAVFHQEGGSSAAVMKRKGEPVVFATQLAANRAVQVVKRNKCFSDAVAIPVANSNKSCPSCGTEDMTGTSMERRMNGYSRCGSCGVKTRSMLWG